MVVRRSRFHLDCIHREFSAKGEMRCPNCRNVETSQWLFLNSPRPSNELNVDGLLNRGDVMSQRIYPEAPQFQSDGVGRGLAYAVLDSSSGGLYSSGWLVNDPYLYPDSAARAISPTEGLGSYAWLTNQPYPYSTTHAEGHVGWSSNQPQFQFAGFSPGDAAAAALESFTSFLNSGGSLTNPRHHPYLEVPAISSTNPPYDYPEHAVSSTRDLASHGSLMTQPYPDSATRAELRSQNLNAYILGARNQGREPATG
ncbi:putative Zinc finger, RING/FYVE/PHD-type [Helianthus annuus]|nr:putative Zinc finger, RING/FYVE/PHD-type [Helianthus annuus]